MLYICSTLALIISVLLPTACAQCPNKPGFVTKANTNWVGSSQTKESQTTSANAEQICNLDANCLAFNSNGYYVLKQPRTAPTIAAAGIKLQPYDGMCTYIKQSALPFCPDRAGYATKENTNWAGSAKTKESLTTPDNAEKICNLDANCLAFNSFGYYLLKPNDIPLSISAANISFNPYDKLCIYVKSAALPAQLPEPVSPFIQAKIFVFRNAASRQCFAVNDLNRLPLMGMPRLLASNCSKSDKSQVFKVLPAEKLHSIIDAKDRCLTPFLGLLMKSAGFTKCADKRADQLWALNSTTPNEQGPYLIQSKKSGTCIAIERGSVILDACNPRDTMMLFESAFV